LPPLGLIDFSVGVTEVVGVVDVSGAFSPPPHAAVKPTMATIAVPPATAARRRAKRLDLMMLMFLTVPEWPICTVLRFRTTPLGCARVESYPNPNP